MTTKKVVIGNCIWRIFTYAFAKEFLRRKGKECFAYKCISQDYGEYIKFVPHATEQSHRFTMTTKDYGPHVSNAGIWHEESTYFAFMNEFMEINREDPILIAMAEEYIAEPIKSEDIDESQDIRVVEIPANVDYEIMDHDGHETIHEKHRSWYK